MRPRGCRAAARSHGQRRGGESRGPSTRISRRTHQSAIKASTSLAIYFALAFVAPALVAQDYANDKPQKTSEVSIPLTPEQVTALQAVDIRVAGIEGLAAKIDDVAYKANTDAAIAHLKKRRKALEKNFDAGLYEALMHSVISRYQLVALWLTPPRLPTPAAKPMRSSEGSAAEKTAVVRTTQ